MACPSLQILIGGLFFGYLFLFGSIMMVLRGWKPRWFATHYDAQIIAGIPYRRTESPKRWAAWAIIALILSASATLLHHHIFPEAPDMARSIIDGIKTIIPTPSNVNPAPGPSLPISPCFSPLDHSTKATQSDSGQYPFAQLVTVSPKGARKMRLYASTLLDGTIEVVSPKNLALGISVIGPPLTNAELSIDAGVVPASLTLKITTSAQANVFCIDRLAPEAPVRVVDRLRFQAVIASDKFAPDSIVDGIKWRQYYSALKLVFTNISDVPLKTIDLSISTDELIDAVGIDKAPPGQVEIVTSAEDHSSIDTGEKTIPLTAHMAYKTYKISCRRLVQEDMVVLLIVPIAISEGSPFGPPPQKSPAKFVEITGSYDTDLPSGGIRYPIKWRRELP